MRKLLRQDVVGTICTSPSKHMVEEEPPKGVAVLSMHAPFEVASKLDLYMSYKAFKGFFESE